MHDGHGVEEQIRELAVLLIDHRGAQGAVYLTQKAGQGIDIGQNKGCRVVDLVGNASGQHADGGELFRLQPAQLAIAFLGNIADVNQCPASRRGIGAHIELPAFPHQGAAVRGVLANRLTRELCQGFGEILARGNLLRVADWAGLRCEWRLVKKATPRCVFDEDFAVGIEQKQTVLKDIEGLAKGIALDAQLASQRFELVRALHNLFCQLVVVAVHFVGVCLGSQGGIDARHDFNGINGLHDEIHRPAFQSALPALGLPGRFCEQDHRQATGLHVGLEAPAHLEPVGIRQISLDQG